MFKHAEEARSRGIKVIIAGAGGAAIIGMVAAKKQPSLSSVYQSNRALSGVRFAVFRNAGGVPVATGYW